MPKAAERMVAKNAGHTHYYTGRPCKHGHVAKRFTSSGYCIACANQSYTENRGEKATKSAQYVKDHPEQTLATKARYREKNREKLRKAGREYIKANQPSVNAHTAKRRAAKLQRTPPWSDLELISVFYALSKEMTEETGVPHEVDHIIPLQGATVSGLHVPTNLQVIPMEENRVKGNRYNG